MIRLIKNCIIIISVVAVLIGAVSALSNVDILFPKYEMTESVAFAQSIGKGWNLGNTFDACEKYSDKKAGLETETMWGNPETTKELIAYLKECGFDTLRLPVTWSQHMGNAPDYTVDKAWMDRVQQVIDYALECGLKVILNTHHEDAFWLITDEEHKAQSEEILCKLWTQICERFAAYDENLIFETMNEPRVTGTADEWQGNAESREIVNYLNFAALNTIRNSGGKNAERFVMMPTYAASGLDENIDAMRLPDDERVIVSVHYYFATAHQSEFYDAEKKWNILQKWSLYKTFRRMAETYLQKGYGVCKSEFGWTDRENMDNLVANTKFYVTLAEKFGFSMAVWDNGITDGDDIYSFGIIDRNELKVVYPEYLDAIV
jgi:endoglucanase